MTITDRLVDAAVDRALLPDPALRRAIRLLLRRRLAALSAGGPAAQHDRKRALLRELRSSPVAVHADAANDQHYDVPAELFEVVLGRHLKYSSALWPAGVRTLTQAEQAMLALTCDRAQLSDGQDVLELGCGWGSLTLWMAQRYPESRITAVSNSASQRQLIDKRAAERNLGNVTVVTADVSRFGTGDTAGLVAGGFDRVVSVEMFEHVRNHRTLLERIASWLRDDGKLFVHVFAHRQHAYPFQVGANADWMARHFFTGGLMPSDDLLLHLQRDVVVDDHWVVSGTHYARTCEAWLKRLDVNRTRARDVLAAAYGRDHAEAWLNRWRTFFIACAELFAYDHGEQWRVSHYRFTKR